jgi:hypothetical protein
MTKSSYIPNTWGIPKDQAKKVQEALNKKHRLSPMIALMNTLQQAASEIADREPEPNDWADWIAYLLQQLQAEAEKDFKARHFETMLVTLRESLNARIDKGKW